MNNEKFIISNNQFRALIVCLTWPTIINYGSSFLARQVGRDMWISGAISVVTTLLFVYLVILLGRNFPGKTIVEYSQDLLGTISGKLVGLVLSLYLLFSAANSVSMYIHHLTDFLLPETPFLVVTVMHLLVICYLIWYGPEVIGRMGIIAFVLACFFYFLVFLASLSEFDFIRLMPFFDSGLAAVSRASLSADTFTGVVQIVIAMILPMVATQSQALRSAATGLVIGGSFFVFYFIAEIMVMGEQLVALMRIASMDLVRSIQITEYLHRFESFMVALWYWSILVQAGILAYCAIKAFTQTVGIKHQNPYLVLLSGILIGVITYYAGYDRVFFLNFREFQWQYFALPVQFILPAFLWIVMIVRNLAASK